MSATAVFLNALMCTSPAHSTCMPAQFVWMAPKFLAEEERVQQCAEHAEALNKARKDMSVIYRCEAVKGA
ncbi:hypothetical protein [Pseudomonas sp. NPDC007930]|uniref:hypothetical protein n=1 Tax=Pseudomonas sp. NPDC007930 TaxID=3364417 RepID=UPI0036EB088C